ncbi:4-aminobutyrate aminotransferase [Microvirga sp. GCM10011540]|uniref:4-aminobutyrate aminotransferase n=1 Tax=Microvirga sp. GCM10011540 TaxID=3317338 RepID=UPI00360AD208
MAGYLRRFGVIAGAVLCLSSVAGHAQTNSVYRAADAVPGKTLRLGLYGSVKRDCSVGPAPEVRVLTPPKHGSLAVRSGKVKASRVRNCPNLEAPVQGVFYQPARGYTGPDEVRYEVKSAEGTIQAHTVRINVTERGGAKPQTEEADEL